MIPSVVAVDPSLRHSSAARAALQSQSGHGEGDKLNTIMAEGTWRRGGTPQMTFSQADIEAAEQGSAGSYTEVPQVVHQFLEYMYQKFLQRNTADLHNLYENTFSALSERYFKASSWPSAETISPIVNHDEVFLVLYKELYYRHLFSNMQPNLQQRCDGWQNYMDLFDLFLKDRMIDHDLPASWLWDMIDEFIYQFETWCQYRAKLKSKTPEEIAYLETNDFIWNVQTVLSILHVLASKSNIIPWLLQGNAPSGTSNPEDSNFDTSTLPIYRYIGYFSIIGLLRVNTLLGDYKLALMVLQPLDFNPSTALFTHVTACHVSIYYFMGFCYIMLRRYEDAVRVFSATVMQVSRIKHGHTKSYQYDQISKRNDQMMALLSLCLALRPQHVDESVSSQIRDKSSDRLSRMRQGDQQAFEDLFNYASPKFICPAPPDYSVIADTNMNAPRLQARLFMEEVKQQLILPEIRSFLKLYTTIEIEKLATLMDVEESTFRSYLHALKHKSWAMCGSFDIAPLDGKYVTSCDVGFHIEGNVVHISDTKPASRFGEYFMTQIEKFDEIVETMKRKLSIGTTRNKPGAYRRTQNVA